MTSIEQINSPHTIAIGISPNEGDIAVVSIDSLGTPGRLNLSVMKEYGYSENDLPKEKDLGHGFSQLPAQEKKAILFVVTVNGGNTGENLQSNLYNTLAEFRGWIQKKKVWLPLLGTGAGGLSF